MSSFETLRLEHTSTVDRVAEELRRALFDGEVEPGTALREQALAEAMGVSRSTIREALGLLVAEGLATREPNRGVHVTELDPVAVHDVSVARAVLELAGVQRWGQAGEEAREACRQSLRDFGEVAGSSSSPAELTAAHLAIHRSFVGLTESSRLVALAEALTAEIRLALAQVDRIRRNAGDQVHSHARLLDLLDAGEVDAAVTELGEHLRDAEASMLTALDLEATRPGRIGAMRFLLWVVVNALALAAATWLLGGITLTGDTTGQRTATLLVVAVVFGVVNAVVRPVVTLLSLPFIIVTLGLMIFVINALMLLLTSALSGGLGLGFHVDGFGTALVGALVVTVATWVLELVLPGDR